MTCSAPAPRRPPPWLRALPALLVARTCRQPQWPNAVRVEGEANPAHAGIIDRLGRMDLSRSSTAADIVWGSTARFEIPCHPPRASRPATQGVET